MTFAVFDQAQLNRDVERSVRVMGSVPPKLQRRSMRRAAAKCGTYVLRKARVAAPRGATGLFKKSFMKKAYTRAAQGVYMSIVGQRLIRAGGSDQGTGKAAPFSAKASAKARSANFGISTGISGTGKAVPMHFTSRKIKMHPIPKGGAMNSKLMVWNRGKGNVPFSPPKRGFRVRHPGVSNSFDWLDDVRRSSKPTCVRIFASEVRQELDRIVGAANP